MAIKQLKKYQEGAVNKLIGRTKELFEENASNATIVFQSPTGSGKTFMMTKYIEKIIEEFEDKDFVFLWISIGRGNLHLQSYESLKKEFGSFPEVYLLEEKYFGSLPSIDKNDVVVVNWEKLRTKDSQTGEWKNILMKESEKWNFREVIRNTREEGKTIIMIIDESHTNATSDRALELRDEIIQPHLTIEMSATPVLRQYDSKVTVNPTDVIEEGMIKKEIVINENLDEIAEDEMESLELIMEAAFRKRLELKQLYEKENSKVNPLVLIQLPTGERGDEKKERIETFLAGKDISYDNKKLAVWLSEEKINNEKEYVTHNESEVEFLIFKQAIDTGWDCPRAQILVKLRETQSIVFEIQTVGRILRMPEAKHYYDERLNKGYIYTDVKSIEVKKEDYNPNIIKSIYVKRKDIYQPLQLLSYYRPRIDFGDITSSFYTILEKTFCEAFGIKMGEYEFFDKNKEKLAQRGIKIVSDVRDSIIENIKIDAEKFDELDGKKIEGSEKNLFNKDTLTQIKLSQSDIYTLFEQIIRDNLLNFAPKRSVSTVKQAIYRWFKKYLDLSFFGDGMVLIQSTIVNHFDFFSILLNKAVRDYIPIKEEERKQKMEASEEWNKNWEIEKTRNYNPHIYKAYDYSKSLYVSNSGKSYLRLDSQIEKDFIDYLEKNTDKIVWWWQNGNEHMRSNFGIKYLNKQGEPRTFQPDFLVMFENGQLGIFDTKAINDREEDTKLKAEALQQYILDQNKKGKNLFGGIVIKAGNHFLLNNNIAYNSFHSMKKEWKYIDEII